MKEGTLLQTLKEFKELFLKKYHEQLNANKLR